VNTLQQRHHDYILGPNQDSRLAAVAPGQVIKDIELTLDSDAPFILRSRAVYCQYNTANFETQSDLQGLKTRFSGALKDYRFGDYVSESIQAAYYGQFGNPKPIIPGINYPSSGVLTVDLYNSGATTITDLTFLFRGVKLFPAGSIPGYTYPKTFASTPFNYQINLRSVGVTQQLNNQIFTVRQDADFVLRAGQASDVGPVAPPSVVAPRNIFMQLMDFNKKPYSNDLVRFDVLFGCTAIDSSDGGTEVFPIGPTPDFLAPFGTGPGAPGLFYPEIYIPANHQLVYSVKRDDSVISGAATQDFVINLIGAKVFAR